MKSILLRAFAILAMFTVSITFTACGEPSDKNQTEISNTEYACPMDCENGKTYSEEGICPVCEMDLKEVE